MDERYIAAIDLGSHKIALSVAEINGQNVQFIYYGEIPSRGIRNSEVQNLTKASAQVDQLISRAEKDLKLKIHQAVINLPRWRIRQEDATACLTRSNSDSPITEEEIDFLKSESRSYPLTDEKKEDIYDIIAQSFAADDYIQADVDDIVGTVCETLEGNFKAYIGDRRKSRNAESVLSSLGRVASFKVFTPEHTAEAVLSDEEKTNGVALIEIGAEVTSVSVFSQGIMRYYSSIPFGGRNITDDIRLECGISDTLAENIKLAYGVCMPDKLQTLKDKIIQIDNTASGTIKQLSVKYLSEIITARLKEIIQASLYMIQESGFADSLISGVVATGGVAQTANLAAFIKELSGYEVRIGYPLRQRFSYTECPDIAESSSASIVGMVLHAKEDSHLNCLTAQKEKETACPAKKVVVLSGEYAEGDAVRDTAAGTEGEQTEQSGIAEWFSDTQRLTSVGGEEETGEEKNAEKEGGKTDTEKKRADRGADERKEGRTERKNAAEEEEEEYKQEKERKRNSKRTARENGFSKFGRMIWTGVSKLSNTFYDLTEDGTNGENITEDTEE